MNLLTLSVILAVRNEQKFIGPCLDQIFQQEDVPANIEVLVVDGMSTDQTCKIILAYQEKYSNLILINNPGKIVPTGLNLAIRQASGQIIIRIDGHTTIAPDYFRQCVQVLTRTDADNVGGRMNAIGNTPYGEAVAVATSTPFGVGDSRFHYTNKEEWVDSVYMGAWRREVFERIGLFDEELVRDQDDEFNYRLLELGGKILISPVIKSVYTVRSNPTALWRQYYQYGYWKVRVLQKHPRQMSLRQFVPPFLVLALVSCILLTILFPWGWILLTITAGSYFLANLASSIISAAKKGWRYLPYLPVTFAILHLSYGFGFLSGLVKFLPRWGDKYGKVPNLTGKHV